MQLPTRKALVLSAVIAASLPLFSLAQICNNDYLVNNTAALTDISRDCTTINGSLYINPNFTGPFVLDRVTNITDFLGVARWLSWDDDPHLETLELPDLEWINTLVFGNLTAPRIYAPKLESIRVLRVEQDGIGTEVLFPELRAATEVSIQGNQSRIDLDSLQTVEASLFVDGLTTRYDERGLDESVETTTSLNLTLSSLKSAGDLSLKGRIPSIALPEFETAGDYGEIRIDVQDAPAAISMPSFDRLDGSGAVYMSGSIASIDLSSLQTLNFSISIHTTNQLNISLQLETASEDIFINGPIETISLPNLTSFSKLSIYSSLALDCEELEDDLMDLGNRKNRYKELAFFTCNSSFQENSGLSTRDKVAIGVVVGVVGLGIIAGAVFWFWKRKKTGTQRKVIQEEIDLPAYSPADPAGVGAHAGDTGTATATATATASDAADAPPAYSAR